MRRRAPRAPWRRSRSSAPIICAGRLLAGRMVWLPPVSVLVPGETVVNVTDLAIRLRGVVKRFGPITAVDGLDLDVPTGTCVGLLGPNGAGKSTTMRMLTAQAIADEGEIEVLGYRLPGESKVARAECGVVPQLDNLDI